MLNKTQLKALIKQGEPTGKEEENAVETDGVERNGDMEEVEDGNFDIDIGSADGTANNGGTNIYFYSPNK